MATYKHPGVYVEEIPTLPPSVAQVATAIPAFIGITEQSPTDKKPVRISNMLEYEEHFGGPLPAKFKLTGTKSASTGQYAFSKAELTNGNSAKYVMYYALRLYFSNGGGPCWVYAVGNYTDGADKGKYESGIKAINTLDEPTILLLPDAVLNLSATNYHALCGILLNKCGEKKDRFAIMDVKRKDAADSGIMDDYHVTDTADAEEKTGFRSLVNSNYLSYGAAYLPYLKTAIAMHYQESDVVVDVDGSSTPASTEEVSSKSYSTVLDGALKVTYTGTNASPQVMVEVNAENAGIVFTPKTNLLKITIVGRTDEAPQVGKTSEVVAAWDDLPSKPEGWTLENTAESGNDPLISAVPATALTEDEPSKTYSIVLDDALEVTYTGKETAPKVKVTAKPQGTNINVGLEGDTKDTLLIAINGRSASNSEKGTASEVMDAWDTLDPKLEGWTLEITAGSKDSVITAANATALEAVPKGGNDIKPGNGTTLDQIKGSNMALYSEVKKHLSAMPGITLPPSGAMAGLYCQVDRDRGVWKAPANVAISNVIGPEHYISDDEQARLNIDPTGGKSINAIRSFTGRGTVVWGSRTLDGNSNEWRYVPVRRLFITVEESVQKATTFAVFEPNNINTWLKVKAMIESYLYGLWQQGAMMGASPEEAYFVHVGLGKTMTQTDVLEGRLIVNIGIAAVRPAEFIILRFQHYVQQS